MISTPPLHMPASRRALIRRAQGCVWLAWYTKVRIDAALGQLVRNALPPGSTLTHELDGTWSYSPVGER
jgi:hypothetical protein